MSDRDRNIWKLLSKRLREQRDIARALLYALVTTDDPKKFAERYGLEPSQWAAGVFADSFQSILHDLSAPNFVEAHFNHPKGDMVVTVQRKEGKTPRELQQEAEAQRDALQELLADVMAAWEALPGGKNYSANRIERWLVDDMKPAIDEVRDELARLDAEKKNAGRTDHS